MTNTMFKNNLSWSELIIIGNHHACRVPILDKAISLEFPIHPNASSMTRSHPLDVTPHVGVASLITRAGYGHEITGDSHPLPTTALLSHLLTTIHPYQSWLIVDLINHPQCNHSWWFTVNSEMYWDLSLLLATINQIGVCVFHGSCWAATWSGQSRPIWQKGCCDN